MRNERWEHGLEWETVNLGMIQYMVYAVLGIYSVQCALYSRYAVLIISLGLWHGEKARDDQIVRP